MPNVVAESFCERCGARFTFDAPRAGGGAVGRIRVISRGLRQFISSDNGSLAEAMDYARESETGTPELDAFSKTFNLCLVCRRYTCLACWDGTAGICLGCSERVAIGHPVLGTVRPAGEVPIATVEEPERPAAPAWPAAEIEVSAAASRTTPTPEGAALSGAAPANEASEGVAAGPSGSPPTPAMPPAGAAQHGTAGGPVGPTVSSPFAHRTGDSSRLLTALRAAHPSEPMQSDWLAAARRAVGADDLGGDDVASGAAAAPEPRAAAEPEAARARGLETAIERDARPAAFKPVALAAAVSSEPDAGADSVAASAPGAESDAGRGPDVDDAGVAVSAAGVDREVIVGADANAESGQVGLAPGAPSEDDADLSPASARSTTTLGGRPSNGQATRRAALPSQNPPSKPRLAARTGVPALEGAADAEDSGDPRVAALPAPQDAEELDRIARGRSRTSQLLGRFRPPPRLDGPAIAMRAAAIRASTADAARAASPPTTPASTSAPAGVAAQGDAAFADEASAATAAVPDAVAAAQATPTIQPEPEPGIAAEIKPVPLVAAAAEIALAVVAAVPVPVVAAAPEPAPVAAAEAEVALAVAEPAAVSAAQPEPAPVAPAEAEVALAAEPAPVVAAQPEPVPVAPAEAEVALAAEPAPVVAAQPEPVPVAAAETAIAAEPELVPVKEADTEAAIAAEPEPAPVVAAEADVDLPVGAAETAIAAEPEPAPVVAAEADVDLAVAKADSERVESPEPAPVVAAEPEPAPVATAETEVVLAVAAAEPVPVVADAPEPAPVVAAEAEVVLAAEGVIAAESEVAPGAEPESEPVVAAEAEPAPVIAAQAEVAVEAEPEPVVAAEAEPEPVPEPRIAAQGLVAERDVPPQVPAARPPIQIPTTVVRPARGLFRPAASAVPPSAVSSAVPPPARPSVPGTDADEIWQIVAPDEPIDFIATIAPRRRHEFVADREPGAVWAARMANARPEASFGAPPGADDRGAAPVRSCPGCGLSLSAYARFCRRCGTRQD